MGRQGRPRGSHPCRASWSGLVWPPSSACPRVRPTQLPSQLLSGRGHACSLLPARALDFGYLTQDMIDDYEPALMFTIPRLAIVW